MHFYTSHYWRFRCGLVSYGVSKWICKITTGGVSLFFTISGFLAMYTTQKEQKHFLVKRLHCSDAILKFYGKGSSVSAIEDAALKDKRIFYCGELMNNKIVEEEKKATMLINPRPAIGEWTAFSFPSKNMEYMASGTPLVAYDLPCIPEPYRRYFFAIDDLGQTLEVLLGMDREKLHQFGLEAQKWIVNEKSPRRQLEKYASLMKRAVF